MSLSLVWAFEAPSATLPPTVPFLLILLSSPPAGDQTANVYEPMEAIVIQITTGDVRAEGTRQGTYTQGRAVYKGLVGMGMACGIVLSGYCPQEA